jgi:hypothetical protein
MGVFNNDVDSAVCLVDFCFYMEDPPLFNAPVPVMLHPANPNSIVELMNRPRSVLFCGAMSHYQTGNERWYCPLTFNLRPGCTLCLMVMHSGLDPSEESRFSMVMAVSYQVSFA